MPGDAPWTDVTFAGVYWNEEPRLRTLLELVRPWFTNMVVGVQRSDDATLEIAKGIADIVVEDQHHGVAEPTFSKVLQKVRTPWVFIVSGDELPSEDLLGSFQAMLDFTTTAPNLRTDGFWIHFRSTIDDHDFTSEQDGHTRVFKSNLRWPTTMHSGPQASSVAVWNTGYITHARSLDEMVHDYLRYFEKGRGNKQWEAHNSMMMREACRGVARYRGWEYVQSYDWWATVEAVAFTNEQPWRTSGG